jgi:uncharacterized protein (TIGR02246 family)
MSLTGNLEGGLPMDRKKGRSHCLPQRTLFCIVFCLLALPVTVITTAAGAKPLSTTSSQAVEPIPAPDLGFYEVQVSYSLFKRSFRLVPQQGLPKPPYSRTSLFRLTEDPSVPLGTSLGPQERSGAPGPISTPSCQSPLTASLHVWVKNEGTADFASESPELGLTGSVDGTIIEEFFNTVAAGDRIVFETRSFELMPGVHTYKLVLNAARGQGEKNFQNNSFEGRFEIACTNMTRQGTSAQGNLGTYEDRIAVEDVMARYVWAVDSLDPEGYVAVFIEDAVIDSNGSISKGHKEIRKIVTSLIQRREDNKAKGLPTSNLYHVISNVRITFPKPGEALHQSYWQTVRRDTDGKMTAAAMGRSEDRLVRRNGKWLIQSRKLTVFTE